MQSAVKMDIITSCESVQWSSSPPAKQKEVYLVTLHLRNETEMMKCQGRQNSDTILYLINFRFPVFSSWLMTGLQHTWRPLQLWLNNICTQHIAWWINTVYSLLIACVSSIAEKMGLNHFLASTVSYSLLRLLTTEQWQAAIKSKDCRWIFINNLHSALRTTLQFYLIRADTYLTYDDVFWDFQNYSVMIFSELMLQW